MTTTKLADDLKVIIKKSSSRQAVEIVLTFKRRHQFLFIPYWKYIYPHKYHITVKNFWPQGEQIAPFKGKPLRDSNAYYQFEVWKPWDFNLQKRIIEIRDAIYAEGTEKDIINSKIVADQLRLAKKQQ